MRAGNSDGEQAQSVPAEFAAPRRRLRHPAGTGAVFHQVEDHDRELAALEPVHGAYLGHVGTGGLLITERLQGCLDLGLVGRDNARSLATRFVIVGKHLAEQGAGGPPTTVTRPGRAYFCDVPEPVNVDKDDLRVVVGMATNGSARLEHSLVSDRICQSHDLRAEPVLDIQRRTSIALLCFLGCGNTA